MGEAEGPCSGAHCEKGKGVESTLEITCGYALFGSNQIKSQYQINVPLACEVETETEGRSRRCPRSILLQVHHMLTAGLRRVPTRAPHHLQIPSICTTTCVHFLAPPFILWRCYSQSQLCEMLSYRLYLDISMEYDSHVVSRIYSDAN